MMAAGPALATNGPDEGEAVGLLHLVVRSREQGVRFKVMRRFANR